MNFKNILTLFLLSLLGWTAMAQTTGTISGKVLDDNAQPLPGVTMLLESPQMIGTRTSVSRENGAFLFRSIPPGTCTITATMPGMTTEKTTLRLGLGMNARPTIIMTPQASSQELVVTASEDPVLDSVQVAAHFDSDFVAKLATGRDQTSVARLAPGVSFNGGTGAVSISGANNGANTWLVNGADSRFDNIRSQPNNAIIEDAIQETTILTAAISAEYGQFGGGVINTITKSGGNSFSGSARVAFSNQDWVARTPNEVESNLQKVDDIDNIQTITFGGPILKDRIWFFVAGQRSEANVASNFVSPIPISDTAALAYGLSTGQTAPGPRRIEGRIDEDERIDLKLTGRIAEGHNVSVSFINREVTQVNRPQNAFDISATATRTITRESRSISYNGILTPNFSVELQYSDRESVFEARQLPPHLQQQIDAGADLRIVGTNLRYQRANRPHTNSPQFLGKPDEPRSSESIKAKASYFLITDSMGSHDISAGLERTEDSRFANNVQYVNNWAFWSDFRYEGETAIPIYSPTSAGRRYQSRLIYLPVELGSMTSGFEVQSAYVNDTWTLNDKWRFNLGFRFDSNEGLREDGLKSADDSIVSPRLSISYDLHGDGKHEFNASYSIYAQRIGNAANDGSQAGSTSFTRLQYTGPQTENYLDVIQWIDDTYGDGFFVDPLNHPNRAQWEADLLSNNLTGGQLSSPTQVFGDVSPTGVVTENGIDSPNTKEFRLGYTHRFGSQGYIKADFVHRDYEDFYVDHTDLLTGPTANGNGDLNVINNSDNGLYEKQYDAVQTSFRWRFNRNFQVSGNYTWSQLIGNTDGGSTSGILSTVFDLTLYPEYNNFDNRAPRGYLFGDQRHILNIFAIYTLESGFGNFDFGATQRYADGSPFNREWTLDLRTFDGQYGLPERGSVGYVRPPSSTTYVLSRGQDRAEDTYETNLGITWTLPISKVNLFIEINAINIFNQNNFDRGWSLNTEIGEIAPFNVFTETPVEGVHYELDPNFGQPDSSPDYQDTREFSIDVGLKF